MADTDEAEKRNIERKSVAINAVATDAAESFRVPCTIRDASMDGARIYCTEAQSLPDEFLLCPTGLTEPLKAEVRWRQGKWVGCRIAWDDVTLIG